MGPVSSGDCRNWCRGRDTGWGEHQEPRREWWNQAPSITARTTLPRSSPISRDLGSYMGRKENDEMRNTWVPGVPEAPPSIFLCKESGSHHPSHKYCTNTEGFLGPIPERHSTREPHPRGRARCREGLWPKGGVEAGSPDTRTRSRCGLSMLRCKSITLLEHKGPGITQAVEQNLGTPSQTSSYGSALRLVQKCQKIQ